MQFLKIQSPFTCFTVAAIYHTIYDEWISFFSKAKFTTVLAFPYSLPQTKKKKRFDSVSLYLASSKSSPFCTAFKGNDCNQTISVTLNRYYRYIGILAHSSSANYFSDLLYAYIKGDYILFSPLLTCRILCMSLLTRSLWSSY